MSSLSIYLPPFASDYAGACSALFDFDCLVAVNDASCCTANYVTYDEPRWSRTKKTAFCMNLRMNDAIFGIDDKVLRQLGDAADALRPSFAALVGTPVPALIGSDVKGLALELEDACGVPTFGLPTTGFGTYIDGLRAAFDLLLQRWAPPPCAQESGAGGAASSNAFDTPKPKANDAKSKSDESRTPPTVNLLGMTPLDYGLENDAAFKRCLEEAGVRANASLFMESSLEEVRRLDAATCNVAVSFAGIGIARALEKRYGTPWVATAFAGTDGIARAVETIRAAHARGNASGRRESNPEFFDGTAAAPAAPAEAAIATNAASNMPQTAGTLAESAGQPHCARVLIVGDQVIANSVRDALRNAYTRAEVEAPHIVVASFFGIDDVLAEAGDFFAKDEGGLIAHLGETSYDLVIGDPVLQRIPQLNGSAFASLPHPALSSTLHAAELPVFPTTDFDAWINALRTRCPRR